MEKHKGGCRQGKKKVQLSMRNNAGGGGIEGVVMLGGALAFASLVAAFTIKKCNRQDSNKDTANLAATDPCGKEEDGTEGLRFILHESSSILHQNSCSTNRETSQIGIAEIETCELVSPQSLTSSEEKMQCERENSVSGHREIFIHDTEQESIAMTSAVEVISRAVSDHETMNVVENESNDSLVMETIEIEIEDEADAEQPAEETSTMQSSLSKEEEKSSFSIGEEQYSLLQSLFSTEEEKSSISIEEEDGEEYSLIQSFFTMEEEEEEEEEKYSPTQSSFSTEEEEEEEYSPMRSSVSTEEEEEEYSPMRSSFSTEEEEEEEESPIQSSFSTEEDDEEENIPTESSFSSEEEEEKEEEEEEEYSPMQPSFSEEEDEEENLPTESSFSTEEEEEEEVTEMEEDSPEGTWSSSTESNTEAIWPVEMMVLSPESTEININHGILSVKKFKKDPTAKIEDHLANTFDESSNNDGKNKKETQELVVMNDRKEHSAKWQIRVWISLVLLLLILLANCFQQIISRNGVSFVFP